MTALVSRDGVPSTVKRLFSSVLLLHALLGTAWGQGHEHAVTAGTRADAAVALPHNVPDFCATATISSVASGPWSSPATWSPARVPAANDVVNVQIGTVVTYDVVSDTAIACVGINGRLIFRTDTNTRLTAGTTMVYATGWLEIGREGAPVPAGVKAELVIANRALNTTADPEQFGTGLIGFGTVRMYGATKTPTFVRLSQEPAAGATTLTFGEAVSGWQAGDRIVVPDTRHLKWNEIGGNWRTTSPQWEERTIQAVAADGKSITLNAGLTFSHLGARDSAGTLRFLGHVGNLTRNVVVRSEVPLGTAGVQGHVIFIERADVDIRYALFRDLGRTLAQDTGPSNPIGRYPIHFHHLMGPQSTPANGYQFTLIGNAVDGGSTDHFRRWGITVHNSHYGLITDNIVYNYGGASVVTEDGSESYNVFEHNFALRSRGHGGRDNNGNEGVGFWFRGPNNYVRKNVASDFDSDDAEGAYGFKYFMRYVGSVPMPAAQGQNSSLYPSRDANSMPLLEFSDNEVYGASQGGLTYWWVSSQDPAPAANPAETVIKNLHVWHVYNVGIYHYPAARITFDGLVILGKDSASSACCGRGFHGEDYAATTVKFLNADIEGMIMGIKVSTFGSGLQSIENSFLKNESDVVVGTMYCANGGDRLPERTVVVRNSQLRGTTTVDMDWNPSVRDSGQVNLTQKDQVFVYGYQGVASDNFRVYYSVQSSQNVAGGIAPCATTRVGVNGLVCPTSSPAAPTVSAVSPGSGPAAGGLPITITGASFASGATVMMGAATAGSVNVTSATTISAVAPAHAPGPVSVVVTNPDAQSGTLASGFTYTGCVYALSPTGRTHGSAGGTGAITMTAGSGCAWSASSNASWLTATSSGSGNGSISYSVAAHTGTASRTAAISGGGQSFTVTQTGIQTPPPPVQPTVALLPTTLNFGAVNTASGALTFKTPAQSMRLMVNGAGTVTWTVSADQPWITLSPASGSGAASIAVSINNTGNVLPLTGSLTATLTFTTTGASNSPNATVNITMYSAATATRPTGTVDTPTNGLTGVTGSIPVTGWAIDDLGVTQVKVYRDAVAGEAAGSQVFIGNALQVYGARPDIAGLYPKAPYFEQAGWGLMVLTNYLPNQGNGTFTLRAYADDLEGNTVLLGSKTMTCSNSTATTPFGTIDTPGPGDVVSGAFTNFGWALAPGGRQIPANGSTITVYVDSVPLGTVTYNQPRSDIQSLFPGYANTAGPVGYRGIDSTAWANGVHTMSWTVADSTGAVSGIGSRFFTIANSGGAGLMAGVSTAAASPMRVSSMVGGAATEAIDSIPRTGLHVGVRHGLDSTEPLTMFGPDPDGIIRIRTTQLERLVVELDPLRAPDASYRGYTLAGTALRLLPAGSHLDERTGEFAWEPAPGFGGTHALVFLRSARGGSEQIRVDVTVDAQNTVPGDPQIVIDMPGSGARLGGRFTVAGWALDPSGPSSGPGVDTLHVWAYPADGGASRWVGAAAYGGPRVDVAALHGSRFLRSGFTIEVANLPPGTYTLAVYAHSSAGRGFVIAGTAVVTIVE